MDEVWAKLQSATFRIIADNSPYKADRAYAKKLDADCVHGDWKTFYEGIAALERGCGYSDCSALAELCKTAGLQNDQRLVQVIEQKTKLFDMVFFLRSVEPTVKLTWISNNAFTRPLVLFECLRQALQDEEQDEPKLEVIVKGLYHLQQTSSEYFQYLLSYSILYKDNRIPVMSKLFESLPTNGWAALSRCVSFDNVTQDHIRFWDQCTSRLDWAAVYGRAEPMLETWGASIAQSSPGHNRQSLYCDVSNILVSVLIHKLGTFEQYLEVMEKAVYAGERAMYRWYEHETQQLGAFLAYLSVIAHLSYVWMGNTATYAKPFPEKLRLRCLIFISQWRHLWISRKQNLGKEILQLEKWLKCVSTW